MIVFKQNTENNETLIRLNKIEKYIKKLKGKKYLKKIHFYENKTETFKKLESLKESNNKLKIEFNKIQKENKIVIDKLNQLKIEEKRIKKENQIHKKIIQLEIENKLIIEKGKNEIQIYTKILNEKLKIKKKFQDLDLKFLNKNNKIKSKIKELEKKICKFENIELTKIKNNNNLNDSVISNKKIEENKNLEKKEKNQEENKKEEEEKKEEKILKKKEEKILKKKEGNIDYNFTENNKKEIEKILNESIKKLISENKSVIPKSFLNDYEIINFKFGILKSMIKNSELEDKKIINYLKKNKNTLNILDNKKHSLLYYSILASRKKLLQYLKKEKKTKFQKLEFFNNPLKEKKYSKLLEINLLPSQNKEEEILLYSFKNNMPKILKNLFKRKKKINLKKICKEIYQICSLTTSTNTKTIKLLIQQMLNQGSTINDKDPEGRKLIHYSVYKNNNLEILKYIIEIGGNINDADNANWKPIHYAARYSSNLEIFKFVYNLKKNNILDFTKSGTRSVHCACCNPVSKVLKFILDVDCHVGYQDFMMWKPIHFACDFDLVENVKVLILHGADILETVVYEGESVSGLFFLNERNKRILNKLKLI